MSAGIVLTSRLRSTRLPNKALKRIGRDTMIVKLLKNLVQNNTLPVVVAMPESPENDVVASIINDEKVPVEIYRGEDDSMAHRVLAVALNHGWDYVAIVQHDHPLIDQRILYRQLQFAMRRELDYTYIRTMPEGTYGDVVKVEALQKALEESKPTEHIAYLMRRSARTVEEFKPPSDYKYNARLCVDYPEDLELVRIIDHNLAQNYTTLTVIDYLRRNAYLMNRNRLPDVTVLITNYNYAKYVVDAIASVAVQTEQKWECLIYDDCSTDESLRKIVCYLNALDGVLRRKFQLCTFPSNQGLGALCNKALQHVRGRYYIRLDADDILRNDALQTMRKIMDASPDIEGVWSGYKLFGDSMEEKNVHPVDTGYEFHPACCMLRTDTVLETGYRERQTFYEGADFLSRFRETHKIELYDDALWARRLHAGQMTDEKTSGSRKVIADRLSKQGIEV